jgi:CHAT domain-containing protein/tetratricopeptide (TPR) repeat protein
MRSSLFASTLAITLAVTTPIVGSIGFPEGAIALTIPDQRQKEVEAERLLQKGFQQYQTSQFTEALQSWQEALHIFREIENRAGEGRSLGNLGLIYYSLGNYPNASKFLEESLIIARELNDELGEQNSLGNLGVISYSLGNYKKGINYVEQSLVIARKLKNKPSEQGSLGNLGAAYYALGNYSKAINYLQDSLILARELKDNLGIANSLLNLGNCYQSLGNYAQAIKYHEQSLTISRNIRNRQGEGNALANLGTDHKLLGNYVKAIEYHEQSLEIAREIRDRKGEGMSLGSLGTAHKNLADYAKAMSYQKESLKLAREIGDRRTEGSALSNLGVIFESLRNYDEAIKYYQQGLFILEEIGDREGEATSLNNIGYSLTLKQQPELAILFFKKSVYAYENIRTNNLVLSLELQRFYTKTVESTYRNLADLLLKADRILEAQQVLDLLKVQELNTYLSNVRGKTPELYELPPETEILKRYGEIQTTAIELGQKLTTLRAIPEQTRTKPQQQEIDRLVQLQIALNQQFNTFLDRPDIQKLITALSPKTLRQTVDTTSLDALRDDLKKLNAVLIYPLILDDRLELIITTPDSPPLRRTVNVKREELNQAIHDFRAALQNPKKDAKPIAQKLYNWLIKPLEADLKTSNPQTLIYAPDAQLRYIPIAALHDGTQWLTQRYAINHITAQSLTDLTAQPTKAPKILAGAIGNRSASIALGTDTFNFGGLAYTTKEVQSIQQLQPTTRILDGDAFSLNNVTPKLGDYNILHLATHAALVPKKVENSFILFGSSTYATLRDIESWTLNNFDLVVLSACETGLGGNFGTGGEEILGLGYQFQSRGAKATIASLWQVDDGGTQILMTAFYSALKQGHSKTKALQLAQSALITNDFKLVGTDRAGVIRYISKEEILARSSHPAYWAPFILIGNGL